MPHKVLITGLASGGKGVARLGNKVVFTPFSAPGDLLLVDITGERKNYSEAVVREIIEPSPDRVGPSCPVFGLCGGCDLQHIQYEKEVEWKQRILEDALQRIGKTSVSAFDAPLPCPEPLGSRTRARFHASGHEWGFFRAGSKTIVDITGCPLVHPRINDTLGDMKTALSGPRLRSLRSIEIGLGQVDGKTTANLYLREKERFDWDDALKDIRHLKGFEIRVSPDERSKGELVLRRGDTGMCYEVAGIRLCASLSVFTQTNHVQNERLVKKVVEYAGLKGGERVLDLFSGVGNLTLPLALAAGRATGVEQAALAVKCARENARRNGSQGVAFVAGSASGWLGRQRPKDLENPLFNVVVLDPPRGGGLDIVRLVQRLRPERMVYVSCNPATLARDVSWLNKNGYLAKRACLVDMFPRTHHVEAVVALDRT